MDPLALKPGRLVAVPGPVVLVVMDGVGLGPLDEGNAVHRAHTPVLDALWAKAGCFPLRAHGTAVGLPSDDDMGNSEVGHNALGSGQVGVGGGEGVLCIRLPNQTCRRRDLGQLSAGPCRPMRSSLSASLSSLLPLPFAVCPNWSCWCGAPHAACHLCR